jgi:hypothetical protein
MLSQSKFACINGCGTSQIPLEDLTDHTTKTCANRVVACPNSCGRQIKRNLLEHHLRVDCRFEKVTCPECEIEIVHRKDLSTHLTEKCTGKGQVDRGRSNSTDKKKKKDKKDKKGKKDKNLKES